jgi:hypothetical protein
MSPEYAAVKMVYDCAIFFSDEPGEGGEEDEKVQLCRIGLIRVPPGQRPCKFFDDILKETLSSAIGAMMISLQSHDSIRRRPSGRNSALPSPLQAALLPLSLHGASLWCVEADGMR